MKTASDGTVNLATYSTTEYRVGMRGTNVVSGILQYPAIVAGLRRLRRLVGTGPLSRFEALVRRSAAPLAYDEDTFHYLLDVEQKRSEVANRPCFVMLIEFDPDARTQPHDAPAADQLCSVVAGCLRASDVVGWYRRGSIAGAVLPQNRDVNADDVSNLIARRVGTALRERLSRDVAHSVQLRIWRIEPDAEAHNN